MQDVLPLIAEGATEILYGTDMPVAEYKQRYSILLHKLCALFLRADGEVNTETEQQQSTEDQGQDQEKDKQEPTDNDNE
jgi:hypothetical protein